MPATPQRPYHRWGVRFTSDTTHNLAYLQTQHDEDATNAYGASSSSMSRSTRCTTSIPPEWLEGSVIEPQCPSQGLVLRVSESLRMTPLQQPRLLPWRLEECTAQATR